MAYDDYAPVTTPEDEEEERRRAEGDYPPVGPPVLPGSPAAGASVIPAYAKAPEMSPPAVAAPSPSGMKDLAPTNATPPVAPVQPPAQARLRALTDKGAPPVQPLHGWKKALDIAGQIAAPRIEQRFRYQPQEEYARNLKQAQGDVAAENAPQEEINKEAQTEATTGHLKAETEALKNPQAKVGQTPEELTIHDLMAGNAGQPRMNPLTQKPYTYTDAYQAIKQAAQDVKPEPAKPAHLTYDAGIPVSVTDPTGKTYDINDPKLPPELKPLVDSANRAHGQHISEEATKTAAANAEAEKRFQEHQDALTSTTKSMIETVPKVQALSKRIRPLIEELKGELGPGAGRWNEFWAGKVGVADPKFTKLRTDIGLLQTALMRMHVGARGGEQMMEHFKGLIDSGKQSPENLTAALDAIDEYSQDVAAESPAAKREAAKNPPKAEETKPQGKWNMKTGRYE